MKRQVGVLLFIACFILMTPRGPADGVQLIEAYHSASHPCCPAAKTHAICCLDAGIAALPMTPPTAGILWQGHALRSDPLHETAFSSRSDLPLIRPPIS